MNNKFKFAILSGLMAYFCRDGTGQPVQPVCNTKLWQHVYNPERLDVIKVCIEVTGTIADATAGKRVDGLRHEADGDTHGWLTLDPQFAHLLNAGNKSAENNNLVFEVVCMYPVKQKDALKACPASFHNAVVVPAVASHVRMVGSYVIESNHKKWAELHPVSSITVIE